jgi:hypothetical protein
MSHATIIGWLRRSNFFTPTHSSLKRTAALQHNDTTIRALTVSARPLGEE